MAPVHKYAVVSVNSTHATSHDGSSILVEPGGFAPVCWFLEHGLQSDEVDDDYRPAKRRKTSDQSAVPARIDSIDESKNIPIFRVSLDLHFPETLSTKAAKSRAVEQDVDFNGAESIIVDPSIVDVFEDGTRLRLALPGKTGAVLAVDTHSIPKDILAAIQGIAVKRLHLQHVADSDKVSCPATFSNCTLTRSHGQSYTVVRFEATLYWRSGASAFPAGVPVGKARIYPDFSTLVEAYPDTARDEVDYKRQWTQQDFYDSVHVPEKDMDTRGHFDGVLESELYPFQKRAVHWMLRREGVEYCNGQVRDLPRSERPRDVTFYAPGEDLSGDPIYINHLQSIIRRKQPKDHASQLSGGLLAEEMGLGKTVELMALLSLHKRPDFIVDKKIVDETSGIELTRSKATLIITPPSILQQWRSELNRHSPTLKVFLYNGISSKKGECEQQIISDMGTNYDVVLATYQTLAKEIHFAEDPPDRNMRHARKFKRKRSPLVQIQWWRICLDEAQMVESGVTAAARVARRIPRVNSWAVSGTPVRRNVEDLHGLLIFLGYKPFDDDGKQLWSHLITNHRHIFRQIFGTIALRHNKAQIREDLHLPAQKRVVITVPFSAIEQQNYSTLFSQMCEDVGLRSDGTPLNHDWNPSDAATIDKLRSWLVRLRQTCLHPQVGGKNHRALGRGQGPLRTVGEVLEVMIDQNETNLRVEERALLGVQLIRAHILGNARDDIHRSENALEIYEKCMETGGELVKEARSRLAEATEVQREGGEVTLDTEDEDSSNESAPVLGRLRNNLRTALQLQHACTFFVATAYFQIKSNELLTIPDSDRFKELENQEMGLYESAKILRREILRENSRKAESLMRKMKDLEANGTLTKMPRIKELDSLGGIESRRIVEKSDHLFDVIRDQSAVIVEWRAKMAEYLLKPLVDEDEEIETTGDEYEDSTKLQDELYAYFDAVKAVQADLNTFVTGEDAPLIDHEVKTTIRAAISYLDKEVVDDMKNQVHAPELTLDLLAIRNKFRAKKEAVGSIRALILEARGLETSLQWNDGGARAAERIIVHRCLNSLQSVFTAYSKALLGLEKEIDLFRSTQNQRLEFYRQLQELSDAVKPRKEEFDDTFDLASFQIAIHKEEQHGQSVAQLKTKNRFLMHLREESGTQVGPKICVICQFSFENGVLTVCGHQFCKECIQHWWHEKRTCPVCKRTLSQADFHNITYKPQELRCARRGAFRILVAS